MGGANISCPFDSVRGTQGKLVQRQCCIHEQAARLVGRPPRRPIANTAAAPQEVRRHLQDVAQPLVPPPAHSRQEVILYDGRVASSRYDLSVMRCSWRELNPLSVASAFGVNVHVSLSCRELSRRSPRRDAVSRNGPDDCHAIGSRHCASAHPRWPCGGACPLRRHRRR